MHPPKALPSTSVPAQATQHTPAIMVASPLTVTPIRTTVTLIQATATVMAMVVLITALTGDKVDALRVGSIGDGTAGIRTLNLCA